MEILSVTPDNAQELDKESLPDFSAIRIKKYAFPASENNTYRVFTKDGSIIDVAADNASHAYQLANRNDVTKISRIEFSHEDIVASDVVTHTGEEVTPAISHEVRETLAATFLEPSDAPEFLSLDLYQVADAYK